MLSLDAFDLHSLTAFGLSIKLMLALQIRVIES